jgi:hypothetical protein
MKRREFLATAGAVGLATTTLGSLDAAEAAQRNTLDRLRRRQASTATAKQRDYIELRTYTVKDDDKKAKLIAALDSALIPALNAQKIKPVGVFSAHETEKNFQQTVFVIFPHKTLNSVQTVSAKLLADKTFMKNGGAFFEGTSKDPLYTTYESTLMYGFEKCPSIETPISNPERIFQIRYYRSWNIDKNAKKVHMFDEGGELPLFRKVGMHPVFFGDTIFGAKMPNLTYMLGFENDDARKAAWKAFVESPEWQEIKGNPMYADTATEIVNIFLKPSPGSQV